MINLSHIGQQSLATVFRKFPVVVQSQGSIFSFLKQVLGNNANNAMNLIRSMLLKQESKLIPENVKSCSLFPHYGARAHTNCIVQTNGQSTHPVIMSLSIHQPTLFLVQRTSAMFSVPVRCGTTLSQMHRRGPLKRPHKGNKILQGRPQLKGVVLKTLVMKPRKPNSANRKCVLVRLSNGKEAVAYVPGIGHNLQEHNIVMVEGCPLRDVPGIRLRVIRGKYDCRHVEKPQ